MFRKSTLPFLLIIFLTTTIFAQERFAFDPELNYNASIQSPANFLGYELGDRYTFHAHVLDYMEMLAESSDRVTLHDYGHSHEGRRLVYLVITSPDNQSNIEQIRQNNLRLADHRDADADGLIADQPVIHWMSYNVHGNEPSSTESAMQVAYRLAAGEDAETLQMLDDVVTIIDPCINPDGRDRYAYWYTTMHSKHLNTNPEDAEHSEPWPGGRTNHYWFDLNRDWVWLVHPESQGRIAAYQQWMPQVHIDYHEQGYNSNYFTHPGTTPYNLNLPAEYFSWEEAFGKADAEAFDEHRITYFTREVFDFFYPGYGSSYPSVMGGIGMLREQGGGSRGGRAVKTNDDYILTLRQRVFDHYLTSMAGTRVAMDNREALLRYFRDAMNPDETGSTETTAYILKDNPHDHTYRILNVLQDHGVEIERAMEDFTVNDARDYWSNQSQRMRFDAGSFLIKTDQSRHLFVNTVMQRQMAINDSIMYDMATWSIPLAYNLEAAYTEQNLDVATERITEHLATPSTVTNPDAHYAYLIPWNQAHAPKALAMLWKMEYQVRSVERPFTIGDREYARGTLVVLMGRNMDRVANAASDMQAIANEAGVEIIGLDGGWTDEGINLASNRSNPVQKPEVGLLIDSPFNSYTVGQLWFLFEEWTHFPINRLRIGDLPGIDLDNYDVLILPGSRGNLSSHIDSAMVAQLRTWVRKGGTLVGTEFGARFLSKEFTGLANIEIIEEAKDDEEEEETPEPGTLEDPYVGLELRDDLEDLDNIPGSALKSHLDLTNPLTYGMSERLYSLKFGNLALEPNTSVSVAGYYDRDPNTILASGYTSIKNREKLAGKAFAAMQSVGQGKVVLLLDNTQYRMFWVGPSRMMQNAVMLLPGM